MAEYIGTVVRDAHAIAHWLIARIRQTSVAPARQWLQTELQTVLVGFVAALASDFIPLLPDREREAATSSEKQLRACLADWITAPINNFDQDEMLKRLEQALHAQRDLEDTELLPALGQQLVGRDAYAIGQAINDRMALHGAKAISEGWLGSSDLIEEARLILSSLSGRTLRLADQ